MNQLKYNNIYTLFVVMTVSLSIICNLIVGVEVEFSWLPYAVPASALFYVFTFMFADIVAEIYGFEKAVRMTVYNVIAQAITCGIIFLLIHCLPANIDEQSESIMYFFTIMSREFFSSTIALITARTINDLFIVYFGRMFMGRFFAVRTIFSTVIAEIVMLQIDYNYSFFGLKDFWHVQQLIIAAMIFKLIAAIVLSVPAVAIKNTIKKAIGSCEDNRHTKESFVKAFFRALKFWG